MVLALSQYNCHLNAFSQKYIYIFIYNKCMHVPNFLSTISPETCIAAEIISLLS